MSLSEIMSSMDLAVWPQIGLILFLAAFLAIVVRVLRRKRPDLDQIAALPLADDTPDQESRP